MNLEQVKDKKNLPQAVDDFELDFKPITSGLGFHHSKPTEVKSVITERTMTTPKMPTAYPKKEMNVYQNDLSLFYNQGAQTAFPEIASVEKMDEGLNYRQATRAQRVSAYVIDLLLVSSILGVVMTVMARMIRMDLVEVWSLYPNEITPLVLTLFCGFYLLYFSIFEKSGHSTLGKNLFGLKVVSLENSSLSLMSLLMRSCVSLLNFISLGLFSYFDLQNKVTSSKVVRID